MAEDTREHEEWLVWNLPPGAAIPPGWEPFAVERRNKGEPEIWLRRRFEMRKDGIEELERRVEVLERLAERRGKKKP